MTHVKRSILLLTCIAKPFTLHFFRLHFLVQSIQSFAHMIKYKQDGASHANLHTLRRTHCHLCLHLCEYNYISAFVCMYSWHKCKCFIPCTNGALTVQITYWITFQPERDCSIPTGYRVSSYRILWKCDTNFMLLICPVSWESGTMFSFFVLWFDLLFCFCLWTAVLTCINYFSHGLPPVFFGLACSLHLTSQSLFLE